MLKRKTFNFTPRATVVGLMLAGLVGSSVAHAGAPAARVKTGVPGAGAIIADGAVLLAWTSDAVALPVPVQAGRDKDFLAVIDAEPYSSSYGKVIWTAELESLQVGGVPGGILDSATHNDPHHINNYSSYIDWDTGRKYLFAGGVISKNVFRYDITKARDIPIAKNAVCGTQPTQSSLTDDFFVMPNGNMIYTYMSNFGYSGNELGAGTPLGGGSLAEIHPMRTSKRLINLLGLSVCLPGVLGGASEDITSGPNTYLGEYQVSPNQGPLSFVSRRAPLHADTQNLRVQGDNKGLFFFGNTNAAKEGLPHGMGLSYDAKYMVAADYSVAASIGGAAANLINNIPGLTTTLSRNLTFSTFGVAVRVTYVNASTLDPMPAYNAAKSANTEYFSPVRNTYDEHGEYALAGKGNLDKTLTPPPPTLDPGTYMHSISVVPDGPRKEQVAFHEETEGLMPFSMLHQSFHCPSQTGWNPGADNIYGTADDQLGGKNCAVSQRIYHDGATAQSMCGGAMFYTANVRIPQTATPGNTGPIWHAVYDVGPCAGVSYHAVMGDDRFIVQPIAGIESPQQQDVLIAPVFDRDYPRQHSRRMITFDYRPLLAKGNGISADCNGDGRKDEEDIAECGATFKDPIECHYPGTTLRIRPTGVVEQNSATGLPMTRPGVGVVITPLAYTSAVGIPYAAPFNRLVHNNRAGDCPRVLSAVGQFETGSHFTEADLSGVVPVGAPTTETNNEGAFPGVPYAQLATGITKFHTATEVGGAPTLTNINTAQNMNSNGGPHFTDPDRVGFCLPVGTEIRNGQTVATCKEGSYYDLRPDSVGDSIIQYPTTGAAIAACGLGTSAFKGAVDGSPSPIDPSCVGRVMFMQYFVELNHVPLPGTGSDGDRTLCMLLVNRVTGATMMDPFFVDELTKQPCLDFDGRHRERTSFGLLGIDSCGTAGNSTPGDYCWPGARGGKGGGKPHAGTFERDGANKASPNYFPRTSVNLDGNI